MKTIFAISNVLVVGSVLLMIASLLSYQPLTTQGWVLHTQEVYRHLQDIQLGVTDAEASQRGYLITDNDIYLTRLGEAKGKTAEAIRNVVYMTRDNQTQQLRAANIRKLVDEKFRDMDATIAVRKEEGRGPAFARVNVNMVKRRLERVVEFIVQMQDEEASLLRVREATARMFLYAMFVALIIILVRDAVWFAYQLRDDEGLSAPRTWT